MYCNYCGKLIQEDANVCAYCGKLVAATVLRRKMVRPRAGRKVAGVCLAFADYFDLDVTLIRVLWLLLAILGIPFGIIAYIAAWIVVPEEPQYAVVATAQRQEPRAS